MTLEKLEIRVPDGFPVEEYPALIESFLGYPAYPSDRISVIPDPDVRVPEADLDADGGSHFYSFDGWTWRRR